MQEIQANRAESRKGERNVCLTRSCRRDQLDPARVWSAIRRYAIGRFHVTL